METRLRELREDSDLTQLECAKLAYISKNSYIRYENGERVPPLDTVKICRILPRFNRLHSQKHKYTKTIPKGLNNVK